MGDTIVVWSRSARGVAKIIGDSIAIFDVGERDPVFAAPLDGEIEFLDGETSIIWRISPEGDLIGTGTALGSGPVLSAARAKGGWGLTRLLGDSTTVVLEIWDHATDGSPTVALALRGEHWVSRSESGDIALLSFRPPFTLLLFDSRGVATDQHELPLQGSSAPIPHESDITEQWVSTVPVWLGTEHVLLTLADLGGDRRVLARFHRSSGDLTTREMDAPLAFMASDDSSERVLASRDVPDGNLVLYRWTWQYE